MINALAIISFAGYCGRVVILKVTVEKRTLQKELELHNMDFIIDLKGIAMDMEASVTNVAVNIKLFLLLPGKHRTVC